MQVLTTVPYFAGNVAIGEGPMNGAVIRLVATDLIQDRPPQHQSESRAETLTEHLRQGR